MLQPYRVACLHVSLCCLFGCSARTPQPPWDYIGDEISVRDAKEIRIAFDEWQDDIDRKMIEIEGPPLIVFFRKNGVDQEKFSTPIMMDTGKCNHKVTITSEFLTQSSSEAELDSSSSNSRQVKITVLIRTSQKIKQDKSGGTSTFISSQRYSIIDNFPADYVYSPLSSDGLPGKMLQDDGSLVLVGFSYYAPGLKNISLIELVINRADRHLIPTKNRQ